MKKSIISLSFLTLLIVGISTSCKKKEVEEKDDSATQLADASAVNDENSFINEVWKSGSACNYDYTQLSGACVTVTETSTTFPKVITFDFGAGCTGPNGHTKKGKIIVDMSGPLTDIGATRSISFDEFYLNDYKITGTKDLTNEGLNSAGNLNVKVVGNISATGLKGTVNKTFTHNIEWIGHATCTITDDELKVSGSGILSGVNGGQLKYVSTSPVHVKYGCSYAVSGIIDFGPTAQQGAILDYGNGTCDEYATITTKKDSKVYIFNMQTRKIE
jgi:hypothetical protein|tara:strand:- start:11305 stop:12126 length:822 start_codon:yes stop_codon:yes gene_type:complete